MKSSMWKAFDINNIRIERDMLRALATVSAKTDKKIAVQGVDLNIKDHRKDDISRDSQRAYYLPPFQIFNWLKKEMIGR